MDFVLLFEILDMVIIILLHVGAVILGIVCYRECGPVRLPWEKEEKKAAKKKAKEEARARREFWSS